MDAAIAIVTYAIELDNAGRLEESYDKYKEALALLLPLIRGAFARVRLFGCLT